MDTPAPERPRLLARGWQTLKKALGLVARTAPEQPDTLGERLAEERAQLLQRTRIDILSAQVALDASPSLGGQLVRALGARVAVTDTARVFEHITAKTGHQRRLWEPRNPNAVTSLREVPGVGRINAINLTRLTTLHRHTGQADDYVLISLDTTRNEGGLSNQTYRYRLCFGLDDNSSPTNWAFRTKVFGQSETLAEHIENLGPETFEQAAHAMFGLLQAEADEV